MALGHRAGSRRSADLHRLEYKEPNDSGGEDYAVTNWGDGTGTWNDYENVADISGYLVEYGGIGTAQLDEASAEVVLEAVTPAVSAATGATDVGSDVTPVAVTVDNGDVLDGTLVAVVGVDAGTLSVDDPTGLTLEYGYDGFADRDRIGFRGAAADVVAALGQRLARPDDCIRRHLPGVGDRAVHRRIGDLLQPGRRAAWSVLPVRAEPKTWATARTDAQNSWLEEARGDLAAIADQAENDFIARHVAATNAWIGATDAVSEGTWRWIDDSVVGSFGWAPANPTTTAAAARTAPSRTGAAPSGRGTT